MKELFAKRLFDFKSSKIPKDGLLAYYPLRSDALDVSGNNNHGTLGSTSSFEDAYAIFTGVATDEISLPYFPEATRWTVCANVIITAMNGYTFPVSVKFGFYGNNGISVAGSSLGAQVRDVFSYYGHFVPTINTTYNVITSSDMISGGGSIYKNSVLQVNQAINESGWGVVGSKVGSGYFGNLFKGKISDVAIYNRILTQEEITQFYNTTKRY